jgi:hypothetical protein
MALGAAAALIGAAYSARQSGKAADRASDAAEAAGERITDAGLQARQDVFDFFPQAQADLLAGASGAFDIIGQSIPEQQRLLSTGNLNAQGTVGGGFDAVRNALLGLPVDTSVFQPQSVALSQGFQNPFGQMGGIGTSDDFVNTGQGSFATGGNFHGGTPRYLNFFNRMLDAEGGAVRLPDGTLGRAPRGTFAPGSAEAMALNSSPLATRAHQERIANSERIFNRAVNDPTKLHGSDTPTIGGQNVRNVLGALANIALSGG